MGYVADNTNLVVPFIIPLIGYMFVFLYALRLVRGYRNDIGTTVK